MPFRLNEWRAKVQFTTSASMPHLVYKACIRTGTVSNTVYYQRAVCEALARDLGIPIEDLLAELPEPRGPAKHVFDPNDAKMDRYGIARDNTGGRTFVGPANTIEEVR